jgi:tetratricopeptide (TPR) repeat protein
MASSAATIAPLDEPTAIELADAALESGREAEAVDTVAAAAARIGSSAALWQWTALLLRELDRSADALQAFEKAARLAPRDALIAQSVAQTLFEAGRPAVAAFAQALALAPGRPEILLGRAAARCAVGDGATALAELDAMLERAPDWIAGHETLARIRWSFGDRAGFTRSLDRALRARPGDLALWRTLLVLLLHADRFDAVHETLARLRRIVGPDHLLVRVNEAVAFSETGRHDEAEARFAKLATLDEPTLCVRHARHLLRTGRFPAAAARLEPLLGGPNEALAWPYLSLAWRLGADPRAHWLEGDERLIGVYDLADRLPALDKLAALLRTLHLTIDQPLDQSLRGGTQTDGILLRRADPAIRQLRTAIAETVGRYVEALPPRDARHPLLRHRRDRPARFAGSWSVRLTDAGFHANHNHPAGWISAALYVAVPDRAPGERADAGWLTLGQPQAELGLEVAPIRTIEPRPGRLVLFPSTMWHGTIPFASGERITVAFDVAAPHP